MLKLFQTNAREQSALAAALQRVSVWKCGSAFVPRPLLELPAREDNHLGSRIQIRALHARGQRSTFLEIPAAAREHVRGMGVAERAALGRA